MRNRSTIWDFATSVAGQQVHKMAKVEWAQPVKIQGWQGRRRAGPSDRAVTASGSRAAHPHPDAPPAPRRPTGTPTPHPRRRPARPTTYGWSNFTVTDV